MSDTRKLDEYFNQPPEKPVVKDLAADARHTRFINMAKLVLPGVATILISLLIIIPNLSQNVYDIKLDITKPKSGELEKLHMEKVVFNITDKNNKVNNFTAAGIDETSPGSKVVKLIDPEGIVPVKGDAWTNLKSPTGFYDQNQNTIRLTDNVELFYSEGMNIYTFDVEYDFKRTYGWSRSPVSGQGIFGDIKAEGFDFYTETGILTFLGKTDLKINQENLKSREQ